MLSVDNSMVLWCVHRDRIRRSHCCARIIYSFPSSGWNIFMSILYSMSSWKSGWKLVFSDKHKNMLSNVFYTTSSGSQIWLVNNELSLFDFFSASYIVTTWQVTVSWFIHSDVQSICSEHWFFQERCCMSATNIGESYF